MHFLAFVTYLRKCISSTTVSLIGSFDHLDVVNHHQNYLRGFHTPCMGSAQLVVQQTYLYYGLSEEQVEVEVSLMKSCSSSSRAAGISSISLTFLPPHSLLHILQHICRSSTSAVLHRNSTKTLRIPLYSFNHSIYKLYDWQSLLCLLVNKLKQFIIHQCCNTG